MYLFCDGGIYNTEVQTRPVLKPYKPTDIMNTKAQKDWNAPSLTEHGSVEELTAVNDPYDDLTPKQKERICASSNLDGAGYRALCGS